MKKTLLFLTMLLFMAAGAWAQIITITGFEANHNSVVTVLDGNLIDGYVLPTNNVATDDYLVQFTAGTTASPTLTADYFGLYLISSTVALQDLKDYYDERGTPEPFLTYLKNAVDGVNPFVYIKGSSVELADAAKRDLLTVDVDMTIPGDYPTGTFVVEGIIETVGGATETVTLTLKVDRNPVHNVTQDLFYTTIQAAIDAAADDNVIEVAAGTYVENIEVNKENITLKAAGDATISDVATPEQWSGATGANNPDRMPVVFVSANGVTVEGFKIRDYKKVKEVFSVVRVEADDVTIKNLDMVSQFDVNYLGGASYELIVVAKGDNVTIEGNTLKRQRQTAAATAILKVEREINTGDIVGNVLLKNNTIEGGPIGGYVNPTATITYDGNTVSDVNYEGIWVVPQSGTGNGNLIFTGNTISDFNTVCGTCSAVKVTAKPITINSQTASLDMYNQAISDNPNVPSFFFQWMGEFGPVYNVDKETFHQDVQNAINGATAGNTIKIAPGTYDGDVDSSGKGGLTFIYGASPGCITINGNLTYNALDLVNIYIEGTTVCDDYTQVTVTGTLTTNNATLDFIVSPTYTDSYQGGDEFRIFDVNNIVGTFSNPRSFEKNDVYFGLYYDNDGVKLLTQYTLTIGGNIVDNILKVCSGSGPHTPGLSGSIPGDSHVLFRTKFENGQRKYQLVQVTSGPGGGGPITWSQISSSGMYLVYLFQNGEFKTNAGTGYLDLDDFCNNTGYEPLRQNGEFWIIDNATNLGATGDDVCDPFTTTLIGSHNPTTHDAQTYQWEVIEKPSATASATFASGSSITTTVTVNEPGKYKFRFTVNSPENCGNPYKDLEVKFYDIPDNVVASGQDVCALASVLTGDYDLYYNDDVFFEWAYVSGPDNNPLFGTVGGKTTTVTVTLHGSYVFSFSVTNGLCGAVITNTAAVVFYDTPAGVGAQGNDVCGLTTELIGSHNNVVIGTPTYHWAYVSGPDTNPIFGTVTGTTTTVTVTAPGAYKFSFSVTNGECGAVVTNTATINFYDIPQLQASAIDEVCGLTVDLYGSATATWNQGTISYNWTKLSGPGNENFGSPNTNNTSVTVDDHGVYEFQLGVTNGDCAEQYSTVTVTFYETPELVCQDDQAVCVSAEDFVIPVGSSNTYIANAVGVVTHFSGIGIVGSSTNTFSPSTAGVGQHVITAWATEGLCTVSCTFLIHVYPEPTPGTEDWETPVFSGSTTQYGVDPVSVDLLGGLFAENAWAVSGTGNVDFDNNTLTIVTGCATPTTSASITAFCGGTLSFDWSWTSTGIGMVYFEIGTSTGTILSSETSGSFTANLTSGQSISFAGYSTDCSEITFVISNFNFDIAETYQWTISVILPDYTGYTTADDPVFVDGVNNLADISVKAPWPFTGTYDLEVNVTNCASCETVTKTTITVLPNTFAGQLKYYNPQESPMPSPFTSYSEIYGSINDYFYVSIVSSGFDVNTDDPFFGSIATRKVETIYKEDDDKKSIIFLPAAFEFDGINLNPAEDYRVLVWDGGFYEAGLNGAGLLNKAWTWNNWNSKGRINATDALLIQHMVVKNEIRDFGSAPDFMHHVGSNSLNPEYGFFARDVADANNSAQVINSVNTYRITSLDALLVQHRSLGLLPQFLSNKPNFAVAAISKKIDEDFNFEEKYFGSELPHILFFKRPTMPYQELTFARDHNYYTHPGKFGLGNKWWNIYYSNVGDIRGRTVPDVALWKVEPEIELLVEGTIAANKGDVVEIPICIEHFAELGAISLGLNFNKQLFEVIETSYGEEMAYISNEEGIVRIAWHDVNGLYFDSEDAIAIITIRVLTDIDSQTALFELDGYTELADRDARTININLKTVAISTNDASSKLSATNYPNPFRNTTTISYNLPENGNVQLVVYDKLGKIVNTLVSAHQAAGVHTIEFSDELAPGVYFYRLILQGETKDYSLQKSMIVVQ